MELTAFGFLVASLQVVALLVLWKADASHAQRIEASHRRTPGDAATVDLEEFPRRKELLQALDFLEQYERGKLGNDWGGAGDAGEVDMEGDGGYPLDFDADGKVGDELGEEVYYQDVPAPVMGDGYLSRGAGVDYIQKGGDYTNEEEQLLQDLLWNFTDEELTELALEEEVLEAEELLAEEEEELEEEIEEEMEEELEEEEEEDEVEDEVAILGLAEDEMESAVVNDILTDLMAEEYLQGDAENRLKWLINEEEEEAIEDDPFLFDYFYGVEEPISVDGSLPDGEDVAYMDYPAGRNEDDILWNAAGDNRGEDNVLEEEAEILDNEEDEDEALEEEETLEGIIGMMTREAIEEALDKERHAGEYELVEGGNEEEQLYTDEEDEEEEEIEDEAYNELVEFLSDEIEQAVQDVANDVREAINEDWTGQEEEGNEQVPEAKDSSNGEDYDSEEVEENNYKEKDYGETDYYESSAPGRTEEEAAKRGQDADEVCPSLQYFVDNCNIVNNYEDLGAEGYKELFTGSCNRHQLCYACGSFYGVSSKLCDVLFKAEMLSLCEADYDTRVECKQRAKYFWLAATNSRIPLVESLSTCAEPCLLTALVEV